MKKLLNHIIPFLLAIVIALPVQALTIQSGNGSTIQGGSARMQGSGTVWVDTCIDIFDENFASAPSPAWSFSGGSIVTGGALDAVTTGGSEDHAITTTFSAQDELWAKFDLTLLSGFVISTANHSASIIDLEDSAGTSTVILKVINISGGLRWQSIVDTDPGNSNIFPASPAPVVGTTYGITIQYLRATTSVSADGGARIWIDTTFHRDTLNLDNFDTQTPEKLKLGAFITGTSVAGTVRIDNLQVGTLCTAP